MNSMIRRLTLATVCLALLSPMIGCGGGQATEGPAPESLAEPVQPEGFADMQKEMGDQMLKGAN